MDFGIFKTTVLYSGSPLFYFHEVLATHFGNHMAWFMLKYLEVFRGVCYFYLHSESVNVTGQISKIISMVPTTWSVHSWVITSFGGTGSFWRRVAGTPGVEATSMVGLRKTEAATLEADPLAFLAF